MAPHKIHLPFVSGEVEDLLLWRNWQKSLVVVGVVTLLYIVLEWSGISLVALTANLLLLAVVVSFLWNNIASFAGRPSVPVPDVLKNGVKDSEVKQVADQATVYINKGLAFLYRLISGKDIILVGQTALVLFVVGKIASRFTSLGLVFTSVILAFSLPKVYELKKTEIDAILKKGKEQVDVHYKKYLEPYLSKIPRAHSAQQTSGAKAVDNFADSVNKAAANVTDQVLSGVEGTKKTF